MFQNDIFNSYEREFTSSLKEINDFLFNVQQNPQKCKFI